VIFQKGIRFSGTATAANGDATPTVAEVFELLLGTTSVTITAFDNAADGQLLMVRTQTANQTIAHSNTAGGIVLMSGTNHVMGAGEVMLLRYHTDRWYEVTPNSLVLTSVEAAALFSLLGHTHAAADIASGTMATARLGSGTPSSTTFLRGDQAWAAVPDASTSAKGLVQLASDGQDASNVAVQGNDLRLPAAVKITSDQAFSSSTPANVTGLSFSVVAGRSYYYRFVLLVRSDTATVGVRLTLTIPGATRFGATAQTQIGVDGNQLYTGAITSSGDAVAPTAVPAINTDHVAVVEGILVPSADGTIQVQAGTETGTTTITVRQGSMGLLWDLGT
jgi:hypothetical protein